MSELHFTEQEIRLIMEALAQMPYYRVAALFEKIKQAATAANPPS